MSTGRPDGVGEGAEQRITIVLREAAEGKKTSGVYQREKNRRLSVAFSPLGDPAPAGGAPAAHTAGASSKIPFYIWRSNSPESGPWRDRTSL